MNELTHVSGDEMNAIALEIIMQAGDARLCVSDAIKAIIGGSSEKADEKLDEAKKYLANAHRRQTEIVQSEGEGNEHEHTLLFMHAQDTLMTIYSEMNIIRQLKGVFEHLEHRIVALEKGGSG